MDCEEILSNINKLIEKVDCSNENITKLKERIDSLEKKIDIKLSKNETLNDLRMIVKWEKSLNIHQVTNNLGCTDVYSLRLMKKLGKEKNFKFILGDKKYKNPSIIKYIGPQNTNEIIQDIKDLLENNSSFHINVILKYFNLSKNDESMGNIMGFITLLLRDEKYSFEDNILKKNY